MVTLLAWMAHKLVSSKRPTKYASEASWRAATAVLWNRKSVLKSWAISRTKRWNGSFRMSNSVDFWYLRISRRATVPGRYRWGFFTPPVAGALFRAALVANCFRGAFPPVDFRAVCLVRAIAKVRNQSTRFVRSVWSLKYVYADQNKLQFYESYLARRNETQIWLVLRKWFLIGRERQNSSYMQKKTRICVKGLQENQK